MHVPTPEELIARAEALEAELGAGRTFEALAVVTQRIDHEIRMLSEHLWENRQAAEELLEARRAAKQEHYTARLQKAMAERADTGHRCAG